MACPAFVASAASVHTTGTGGYVSRNALLVETVMKQVYGDWDELGWDKWPVPMPKDDAGPSLMPYGDGDTQRRYLWTDAFGLLNLCTLYRRCTNENKKERILRATRALVDAVHGTLGRPMSADYPMRPGDGPMGYMGLRIGKTSARLHSDAGMRYDGMYWHYIDKWLFALYKLGKTTSDPKPLEEAVQLLKAVHPYFIYKEGGTPMGVRWKVNSDLTPIPALEGASPSDDALSGWLVYSLLARAAPGKIDNELDDMRQIAGEYRRRGIRISTDSLGWGLLGWKTQWFGDDWAEPLRDGLEKVAHVTLDVRSGLALPFRLYGAVLGAKLMDRSDVAAKAEEILQLVEDYEMSTKVGEPHSSINKAMFAAAVDPLAFSRDSDELILAAPR